MPTFRFKNENTGEEYDEFFTSNNAKYEMLEKNSHIKQLPTVFGISGGVGDIDSKTDNGWKEVLSKAAEGNPGTPLAERYGRSSAKDIKTKAVIEKHRKIQEKK
jgi:hypothetical protein